MQRRISLLTQQSPSSSIGEEDVLHQWLHRKTMGYICKSTPHAWLMHWFPRREIDASTVHLYLGHLSDEIQAHRRLPMGFTGLIKKLLLGWWYDIPRKQQILSQYNVIMQSMAQHPFRRRHPELGACNNYQGELALTPSLLVPFSRRSSLDSLEQQNSIIMHAAYSMGNMLQEIDTAQREQEGNINKLVIQQEARSREQKKMKQQLAELAQAVAHIQADRQSPGGERRPSFATVHGVFSAGEEEHMPSTSAAAAQQAARRLSSAKTG